MFKNKKSIMEHIRNVTKNTYAYGVKAYIWEIDTKILTRTKIITLDLK